MTIFFIKNIIINNISQGLQFGSRWILTIVLLKVLSIEMFAVFSFVYTLSNILVSILPFGSHVYLLNKAENSILGLKELASSVSIIFVLFLFILVFYSGFCFFFLTIANCKLIFLSFFLSFFLSINSVFFSFLKGIDNFVYELKFSMIFSILMFFLIVYLYFIGELPVYIILLYLIFVNFCITVLILKYSSILNMISLYELISFNSSELKSSFSRQIYFGLQEIVTATYTQGGMFIIFYIINNQIYGEYRAMLILISPFALVNISFSQVLLNHLKRISFHQIGSAFRKIQISFTILLVIILFIFYLLGKPIVELITKLPYTYSIHNAYIGVLCVIFTSFVYAGYEMFLVVINKQKYRFIVMLLGSITNIVSIFILLPAYGIIGAILTNVISNIVVFIGMTIVAEKQLIELLYIKKIQSNEDKYT